MIIHDLLAPASRRQQRATGVAVMLAVLAAIAGVLLLGLSGWFLTGAAIAGASGLAAVHAFNYLLPSAGIRGLAIIRTLGRYGERLYSHKAASFALADVRPALFARMANGDKTSALDHSGGAIATQLGADVDALEDQVVRRVTLPSALAGATTALLATGLIGPASAFVLLTGLAILHVTTRWLSPLLLAAPFREYANATEQLKVRYVEYSGCSAEIAVYGLTDTITTLLLADARAIDVARLRIVRGEALIIGAQISLGSLIVALVLAVAHGDAPLIALAALSTAAAVDAWGGMVKSNMQRPRITAALARLESLTTSAPSHAVNIDAPLQPDLGQASITITDGGKQVQLLPGGRLVITGPSGVGKTRLIGTILGLRDDAPEQIFFGNEEVRTIGLERLRGQFALSPQDGSLIAGTVADNLRLARVGVKEHEMWTALETACLADTIRALPDGLDHWIGGDGTRLSGGQRKRLALARALLAEKNWLLLDEPSEGLDTTTESRLTANLSQWLDRTGTGLILVSHRPTMHVLARQCWACGKVSALPE